MIKKLYKQIGIDESLIEFEKVVESNIKNQFSKINETMKYNQIKVLLAFQNAKVGEDDFNSKSGYGFNDIGREKLEEIYSEVFRTEDAIVRPTIVSGTHALNLCLTGLLFPGDEIISISGTPYDTLEEVIGIRGNYPGNLINIGVQYKQVELDEDGYFDEKKILNNISDNTKMVYVQRSSGYSWRNSLKINDIKNIINEIKKINNKIVVMLDNCYGEFLNELEPTEVGVDIMAGSLIKNPGGGLAISGGYIVGKKFLIDLVAQRLTSPGIGKEQGLMFGATRNIMQGLFIAPKVVSEALKGAIFCAESYKI